MAEYIAKGDNRFHSLVRPILEYASSIWNPYKTKDIEAIENVQRRATKMLPDMKDLTYEERLRKLKLPSLRYMRLETFKIVTEIYDKRVTEDLLPINKSTLHQTRGHSLKLTKNRSRLDIHKYYFTNRVVDDWNNLPETVITAKNVKIFENRLDKLWQDHPMMYDHTYNDKQTTTGSRQLNQIDNQEEPNIEEQADLLRLEQT
jgi:hypothetical protein